MHLQSTEYFNSIVEKPLQSHNWPHNHEPNRKTSSKQINKPDVLYCLKDTVELVHKPVL